MVEISHGGVLVLLEAAFLERVAHFIHRLVRIEDIANRLVWLEQGALQFTAGLLDHLVWTLFGNLSALRPFIFTVEFRCGAPILITKAWRKQLQVKRRQVRED